MQITATQGGSTHNGMLLRLFVLTGAKPAASQTGNTVTTSFTNVGTFTASITNSANSNIYGAASLFSATGVTVTASNSTVVDNVSDSTNGHQYVTFDADGLGAGTTTRGFTTSSNDSSPFVMDELLAATTIAEDSSAPAVVSTTSATTLTTATFTPPAGSLLVALVSTAHTGTVTTMTVSGGSLTWTEAVKSNPSGFGYAGIWIADSPAPNGTVQPQATVSVPRRAAARAVWRGPALTGTVRIPVQIQASGSVIIRRVPSSAVWGGYAAVSNIAPPPVIPVGPPPVIPTSGGTINPWIRTWRAIAPGDVPASGAELPKIHGRGYIGVADGHVEDVIHEPTPVAGPTIIDLAADAAAAAARQLDEIKTSALDIGRIFADPPYQPKQVKRCGVIRKVGGVLLTCGRKPGHVGKHSDRGLDWR